jgi:hypothetical protein
MDYVTLQTFRDLQLFETTHVGILGRVWRVPGGYIYRITNSGTVSTTFVPLADVKTDSTYMNEAESC